MDSVVLKNLGLRLPYAYATDRAAQISKLHEKLECLYAAFRKTEKGRYLVHEFKRAYPIANVTEEKMLDLVLANTGHQDLLKPARKVVGRGTRRRMAEHAVRKPPSQVGTGSIGFRQNSGQSPDGAEGPRKALWFSEGIRPLPIRRNPKRRFRPTRALGLVLCRGRHPLRHREVGQKRLGGAPPPPATPSCAVAGRCAYNLWISDINIRARMVRRRSARHRRSPDTGNMTSRCDRYALETR